MCVLVCKRVLVVARWAGVCLVTLTPYHTLLYTVLTYSHSRDGRVSCDGVMRE